jgi:hypothetical protein
MKIVAEIRRRFPKELESEIRGMKENPTEASVEC